MPDPNGLPSPLLTGFDVDSDPSSTIGIRFDVRIGEVSASRITVHHDPHRFVPEVNSTFVESAPDLVHGFSKVEMDPTAFEERDRLRATVTDYAARMATELVSEAGDDARNIVAVGVHGCEAWRVQNLDNRAFESFLQPALLAELTGLTIIDNFPARDLAQGGMGGPVEAHGLWLLLSDRMAVPGRRWRALLQLGHTFHATVLPPLDQLARRDAGISVDIGPGIALYHELCRNANQQPLESHAISEQAQQGTTSPELLALWQAENHRRTWNWHPHGVSALPLVCAMDSAKFAVGAIPFPSVLKTATQFLAHRIATFIQHQLPPTQPIGEVILMGYGTKNELLCREIQRQLNVVRVLTIEDLGFNEHILAAGVAALAMLHCWQIPLAPSFGAAVPRVLGRITPGNPSNWQHVLRVMNSHMPWLLPLREAI